MSLSGTRHGNVRVLHARRPAMHARANAAPSTSVVLCAQGVDLDARAYWSASSWKNFPLMIESLSVATSVPTTVRLAMPGVAPAAVAGAALAGTTASRNRQAGPSRAAAESVHRRCSMMGSARKTDRLVLAGVGRQQAITVVCRCRASCYARGRGDGQRVAVSKRTAGVALWRCKPEPLKRLELEKVLEALFCQLCGAS